MRKRKQSGQLNKIKKMERVVFLDNIKGVAIFLIVLGHVYYFIYDNCSPVWVFCHTLQIPLFVFTSGLLAAKSIQHSSFPNLVKKKSVRLLLPFFSIGLLWILFRNITFTEFIFSLYKSGYWFTYTLFEMFILCFVLYHTALRMHINKYLLYIVFYILFTLLIKTETVPSAISDLLSSNLLWHYFPFFITGLFFHDHIKTMNGTIGNKYILYILSLLYIAGYTLYFNSKNSGLAIAHCAGLLLFYTLFSQYHLPQAIQKPLSLWGKYSLEIYLLQYFPIYLFENTIMPNIRNGFYQLGAGIAVSLIIIYLCISIALLLSKSQLLSLLLFGNRSQTPERKH